MADELARAVAFLRRDRLRNIVPLKLLRAHQDAIACRYAERSGQSGVLMLLPTLASPFDAATYPETDLVVLLSAEGSAAAEALLDLVPAGRRLVFKLADERIQSAVARRFALHRATAYISYTSPPGALFAPADEVLMSVQPDERCLELFARQGYGRDETLPAFAAGKAFACARYGDHDLLAACFTYHNFEEIWEIGGLYTLPEVRRRGYARQVVLGALHALGERGLKPRYQVREDNLPSRHLAEVVGLTPFVTVQHYVATSIRRSDSQTI
jgi:hypothetical protein